METFAFCVITFEPIEVQTCSAPQNDHLNLSFVKNEHTYGEKMARNGCITVIYQYLLFRRGVYSGSKLLTFYLKISINFNAESQRFMRVYLVQVVICNIVLFLTL